MKLAVFACIGLLTTLPALALQSPESADHDRCFYQYKDNPANMHADDICLKLTDRLKMPDLQYLTGQSYLLDGQTEKAVEYFRQVKQNGQEYSQEATEQLSILGHSEDEK